MPLIALTTNPFFQGAYGAACITAVLLKPCLPDEVGNAIHGVLGHLSETWGVVVAYVTALALSAVMERRSAFRPQRVLIVDDTDDLRRLWKLWLTGWGFAVEEARNGAEAVEKARSRPPDLILMDYAMPVLDGREAMRLLASDRATAHVPVLAAIRDQIEEQLAADLELALVKGGGCISGLDDRLLHATVLGQVTSRRSDSGSVKTANGPDLASS